MKKSTLKEVIKSKISSLATNQPILPTIDEAFRILRDLQKFGVSRGNQELMGRAIDALQAAEVSRMMDRERGLNESLNPEVTTALNRFIKAMAKRYDYSEQDAVFAIMAALKQRNMDEMSTTGTGTSFQAGVGMDYATPYAFKKKKKK